jgi:hypothetical protein
MNRPLHYRIFHGNTIPLISLSGAALLILVSDRLAHAIVVTGALVWVYCLSSLAAYFGVKFFPRQGRTILLTFLTSFIAGLYLLLLWILSPLCALEVFLVISIIPLFCMGSGIFPQLESLSLEATIAHAFSEAMILGALLIIFALIREPLGYLSLSLPGGAQGIVLLFSFTSESFLPIHLITSSCGALLLLGYFLGLYRYLKSQYKLPEGDEKDEY